MPELIEFNAFKVLSRRKLPLNLSPSDKLLFEHEQEKTIPEHKIIHDKKALITPEGIVFTRGKIETESLYSEAHKVFFLGVYKKYYEFISLFISSEKGVYLLAFDAWSYGYFHWMTEFIPRLFKVQHLINECIVVLPNINNNVWNKRSAIRSLLKAGGAIADKGYYKESLELFNINLSYKHKKHQLLVAEDIRISSHLAPSGNYDDEVMKAIRAFYYSGYKIKNVKPWRRLYISRKFAPRRYVINEVELIESLKSHEFEIVALENLSFQEQVVLFSETQFLIGQHGAALTNLMFMNKDSFVLELKAEGDAQNHCYFSLAGAMEVNYLYQYCSSDERSVQDADIAVDINSLTKNIQLVLGL